MNLKKCKKAHFYDGDKFSCCPHCGNEGQKSGPNGGTTINPIAGNDISGGKKSSADGGPSTIGVFGGGRLSVLNEDSDINPNNKQNEMGNNNHGPVVAWIVGISGQEYGRSYELFATDNSIGNDSGNVVRLFGNYQVMASNHLIISYNNNDGSLYLNIAYSTGKVTVNGFPITSNMTLHYMDTFEIGDSRFMFVPLCKDGFTWWAERPGAYNQNNLMQKYANEGMNQTINQQPQQVNQQPQQTYQQQTSQQQYAMTSQNVNKIQILDVDEVMYKPEFKTMSANQMSNSVDENLTNVLISSPWRCEACNALNSMVVKTCRVCGKQNNRR